MSKTEDFFIFPFQWSHDDEHNDDGQLQSIIRCYGWNEKNESVYVSIHDFEIPMWIELPENIEWTETKVKMAAQALTNLAKEKDNKPLSVNYVNLKKLYYANVQKEGDKYIDKKFPFFEVRFRSQRALNNYTYNLKRDLYVSNVGKIKFKCHAYETSVTPILKMFARYNIPSSNWIKFRGLRIPDDEKESSRMHEYTVSTQKMRAATDQEMNNLPIVYPRVLSFDNEAYSKTEGSMPKATKPSDKVFMIGATLSSMVDGKKEIKKFLLTICDIDDFKGVDENGKETDEVIDIRKFKGEYDLYLGFTDLIKELDPDVILGYNIFGWDFPYMIDRATKMLSCMGEFDRMGCIAGKHSPIKEIKWESKAHGKQEMKYLDAEGRLILDLLPFIKRNYKLSNYRLETVCDEFLKTNKDPIKAKDMFYFYKTNDKNGLRDVGKYCVQDAYVTYLLYEKLLIWFDLIESATTNCVPIFYMYTKGQQIKTYSCLLKYCMNNQIVVQSNAYTVSDKEKYEGAYVSKPIPGIYKMILPFDFASLYPSIIMAHNIDFSKLVLDESIPDELCHVFDWERHQFCEHDKEWCDKVAKQKEKKQRAEENKRLKEQKKRSRELKKSGVKTVKVEVVEEEKVQDDEPEPDLIPEERICEHYRYRFLKANVTGKGVIPVILESLLQARKDTRKVIAKNEDKIKELKKVLHISDSNKEEMKRLEEINQVLDKRQLAYKVSANSAYGGFGVKKGLLSCLPAAMCVTTKGRESIKLASKFLEAECGGQVIYNDTDSAYTYFPHLDGKSMKEVWEYAEDVVERVKKLFPPPMKLEFEGKAYVKFLILTKKRYCAIAADEDGNISKKLLKRGIVLTRRDNCKFLREIYEKMIYHILDNTDHYTKLNSPLTIHPFDQGVIRGKIDECLTDIIFMINKLFQRGYTFKDFVITKGLTKLDYKTKTLPAHVQCAKNMMARGIDVPVGSRIEYVMLDKGNGYDKKMKQSEQVEDVNYFAEFREEFRLRIDYLYYLKSQCVKPIDELLKVALKIENFVKDHFDVRVAWMNGVVQKIKETDKPVITFE